MCVLQQWYNGGIFLASNTKRLLCRRYWRDWKQRRERWKRRRRCSGKSYDLL